MHVHCACLQLEFGVLKEQSLRCVCLQPDFGMLMEQSFPCWQLMQSTLELPCHVIVGMLAGLV